MATRCGSLRSTSPEAGCSGASAVFPLRQAPPPRRAWPMSWKCVRFGPVSVYNPPTVRRRNEAERAMANGGEIFAWAAEPHRRDAVHAAPGRRGAPRPRRRAQERRRPSVEGHHSPAAGPPNRRLLSRRLIA